METVVLVVLLAVGAVAALGRGLTATPLTRLGTVVGAFLLVGVAYGAHRRRGWELGAAFFLGLFWLWAAVALGLQGRMGPAQTLGWIAWAGVVMVVSVAARRDG